MIFALQVVFGLLGATIVLLGMYVGTRSFTNASARREADRADLTAARDHIGDLHKQMAARAAEGPSEPVGMTLPLDARTDSVCWPHYSDAYPEQHEP